MNSRCPSADNFLMQKANNRTGGTTLNLGDLLGPDQVIALRATDKAQAFEELVECLVKAGKVKPMGRSAILNAVRQREAACSTGLGLGVAVALGDTPLITDLICAFGFSREGIPYEALDEQPVKLVLLLLRPADRWMEMQELTQSQRGFMFKQWNLLERASTVPQVHAQLAQAGQDIVCFRGRKTNQPPL